MKELEKKTEDQVFNKRTLLALHTLANQGFLERLGGPVATGKEACVYEAFGEAKRAVKLYVVENSNYRKMMEYLQGDPRFAHIKHTKLAAVQAFVQKEFRNLQKAHEAGINSPKAFAYRDNVLIMEFLGDEQAYPRLKDVKLEESELKEFYKSIIKDMKKLYKKGLVHGDLSEYNILVGEKPYLIDFSQSVLLQHPEAQNYLERDVRNVTKYFAKRISVKSEEALLKFITGSKA